MLRLVSGPGKIMARAVLTLLLGGIAMQSAQAHIIDRIEVNPAGNEVEIQIVMDTRIQFVRDSALGNGEIHIYFNLLEPDPSPSSPVSETKESPPSSISPHFVVSYPELDSALDIQFDKPVDYRIQPGKDGRSISVFVPTTQEAAPAPELQTELRPVQDIEQEASQLMGKAQSALGDKDYETAIATLNHLLNLPPNQQSQAAQKLIGDARAKNDEPAKARVEYELYLKLYPDAADAKEVKRSLAKLGEAEAESKTTVKEKKPREEPMMVYGGLSQNYYRGILSTNSTTTTSQSSWTGTDQSSLISSLDITGRKRTETTDTRLVFRDDFYANFLQGQSNENRVNSAYVEQSARDRGYLYRIGRQSGSSGGVLGRYDGAWAGYNLNEAWRINGVVGTPVDYYSSLGERKVFAGFSVDLTRLPTQWSGSAYYIQQRAGSVRDRQAIGMEARYFDTQRNYISQLDYDTLFRKVNIATFQGNWTMPSGANYNLLIDHRRSPVLQTSNALPGLSATSLADAVSQGTTVNQLRADANALTQTSNQFMVGMTQPYSKHWRLGGDFRITNISGTGAVGALPVTPGSGNIYFLTAQAFGNSLLYENDLGVGSASLSSAKNYTGLTLSYNQMEVLRQKWRVNALLQLYRQQGRDAVAGGSGDSSYRLTKLTTGFKLGYRVNDSVNLEGEAGVENSHDSSNIQSSSNSTRRTYFYFGYRWDFR